MAVGRVLQPHAGLPAALRLHGSNCRAQNSPRLQGKSATASFLVFDQEGIQSNKLFKKKKSKTSKRQMFHMDAHLVFQTGKLVSQMWTSGFLTTQGEVWKDGL